MDILNSRKAYLFGLSAILLWSTVASAFKLGLQHFNSLELFFIANSVSVIVLFILVIVRVPENLVKGIQNQFLVKSAITGFINPFLYYLVLFKGYTLLPAQVAQPINYLWPVVLSLLSVPFLKQKLTRRNILALFLSFSGAFIVISQGNFDRFSALQPEGILYCLLSTVLWSAYWIINLKDLRNSLVKLFYSFAFAELYLIILFIVTRQFPVKLNIEILYPVYIGLFEMSITFFLWMKALELSGHTVKMNVLIYLTPVISLLFIHFILHEEIHFTSVLGLSVILVGIFLQLTIKPSN
jgi:drug/metabolite transporter (DMT)-like permease